MNPGEVNKMDINKELEHLFGKIEDVGSRPAYMKGGDFNDKIEYERLTGLFLDKCIHAFKSGARFSEPQDTGR